MARPQKYKIKLRPHKNDYWCIPPKDDAEFIASIVIQDSIPTILDKCIEISEISIQLY